MRTCTRYFSPEYGSIGKNWLPRAPPNAARPHPMANVTEKTRGTLMPTHRAIRGLSTDALNLAPNEVLSRPSHRLSPTAGLAPTRKARYTGRLHGPTLQLPGRGGGVMRKAGGMVMSICPRPLVAYTQR